MDVVMVGKHATLCNLIARDQSIWEPTNWGQSSRSWIPQLRSRVSRFAGGTMSARRRSLVDATQIMLSCGRRSGGSRRFGSSMVSKRLTPGLRRNCARLAARRPRLLGKPLPPKTALRMINVAMYWLLQ